VNADVVGLARVDVLLGDELGLGLAEGVDPTDVIGVTLRQNDVTRRRRVDGVVVALVRLGLKPHAGVHHDPTVVGGDQVRRRHPRRAPDARADIGRAGGRCRSDREEVRLVADVLTELRLARHGSMPAETAGPRQTRR